MFVAGGIGGFLSGLLGIGGGIVYVVLFTEFINRLYGDFGLSESMQIKMAIANSSFATVFGAFMGCVKQYRINNFYPQIVVKIAIPAVFASLTVSYWLMSINYSKLIFSIIFIVLLLPLILKMLHNPKNDKRTTKTDHIKPIYLILIGLLTGSMSSLSGLGGGFAVVPVLNSILKIKIRKVFSISLGVIFTVSLSNSLFYTVIYMSLVQNKLPHTYGLVSWAMCFPVILGVMIMAPLGVWASKSISPFVLRVIFVIFCLTIVGKTILTLI